MRQKTYIATGELHASRAVAESAIQAHEKLEAYGEFISDLAEWAWFGTFTLANSHSTFRGLQKIHRFLNDLNRTAESPIGWVVAEARGAERGRLHYHLLIAGVNDLNLDEWLQKARRMFGACRLDDFNPSAGGAFYIAKNILAPGGELYFGGPLLDKLQRLRSLTSLTARDME